MSLKSFLQDRSCFKSIFRNKVFLKQHTINRKIFVLWTEKDQFRNYYCRKSHLLEGYSLWVYNKHNNYNIICTNLRHVYGELYLYVEPICAHYSKKQPLVSIVSYQNEPYIHFLLTSWLDLNLLSCYYVKYMLFSKIYLLFQKILICKVK